MGGLDPLPVNRSGCLAVLKAPAGGAMTPAAFVQHPVAQISFEAMEGSSTRRTIGVARGLLQA